MIPEYFAIIGGVLSALGGLYYLYCTIRGTVQPNKVTWLLWGLFPMVAFAAQWSQDVGLVIFATLAAGLPPFLIFVASFFNPAAYWKISRLDYMFAAVAVAGIILWQVTDNANLAIAFAIVADLAAALPTLVKSYTNPDTEDWHAYASGAAGFSLTWLTISVWTFDNYAFVTYLVLVNTTLAVLAARKPTREPVDVNI